MSDQSRWLPTMRWNNSEIWFENILIEHLLGCGELVRWFMDNLGENVAADVAHQVSFANFPCRLAWRGKLSKR